MKNYLTPILLLTIACVTKQADSLTGDLYFPFFRLGNYYNLPDSAIRDYETFFDTLTLTTTSAENKKLHRQFSKLKDEGLLYSPYIYIASDTDSVVVLYMQQMDFDKVKIHKRQKLLDENQKVRIEADVRKIEDGLFYCVQLNKVDLVEGETLQRHKKFRIEDYN